MIINKYKTPLYGTDFTLMIYNNSKDFEDYFKDYKSISELSTSDGLVFWKDDELYIVFNTENGQPAPGIIAHEAKHLVNNIFIHIHHKLSRWNDEPEAYLLGWVVDEIHESLNRQKL